MRSEKIRTTPARFVSRVLTHEVAGHMVQRSVRSVDRQHDQSRRGRNTAGIVSKPEIGFAPCAESQAAERVSGVLSAIAARFLTRLPHLRRRGPGCWRPVNLCEQQGSSDPAVGGNRGDRYRCAHTSASRLLRTSVYVSDSQAPKADIVNKRRLLGLLLFVTLKEPHLRKVQTSPR